LDELADDGNSRFELALPEGKAFVSYRRDGGILALTYTEVPASLQGHGLGSRLVRAVLDRARARGEKIRPLCSFIGAFVRRHPEYRDLVAE
jgi:predicted GNAT family acetyltransferase